MSPSSSLIPEHQVDPLVPLDQLLAWLTETSLHVVLGLALGFLAAAIMRQRHLHYSWAGVTLVTVVLLRGVLSSQWTTLAIASLCGIVRGRRWHLEDVHAGADLGEIAAARNRPWQALRSAWRLILNRLRGLLSTAAILGGQHTVGPRGGRHLWLDGERLTVGHDHDGRSVRNPVGGMHGGTHILVLGAAGSGKTVTMTWIAVQAIHHQMGVVVADPKGDRDLREALRKAALAVGRPFREWTPSGPSVYNPYARGTSTEIADKVLSGERYTEPHYLRQAQRYLGHVVRALHGAGREVTLGALVENLDPARLEVLLRELPPNRAELGHAYLDSLTPRQQSDLAGVRDRLAIVLESDVGRWLDPPESGSPSFDLLEAVREGAVVYFSLESDRRPLVSQMVANAIIADLQTTIAALQHQPVPCLVLLDEFSALGAERVTDLFARARGAGMSMLLGTQELSDLAHLGEGRVLDRVEGNLSALIAHRQVVPASAALIADIVGKRGAWSGSRNPDGSVTRRRVMVHVVDPDVLKRLRCGEALVVDLAAGCSARIARMCRAT